MAHNRSRRWALSVLLIVAVTAPALASGDLDADKVDGFDAVSCHKRIQKRGETLVATCKDGYLPGNIILVAPDSKKLKGKTFGEVIDAAQADLDCTGCVEAIELTTGDTPDDGQILSFDQGSLEWRDLGGITSVTGDDGITGGGIEGDIVLSLDPTYQLPQGCTADQLAKWDDGTDTWTCQNDTDTDTDTTYAAGTGLSLSGTTFSIVTGFGLPQGCSLDRIPKWNGSQWVCGIDLDTTYVAGTGLDLVGTTFNVDPSEVQSRVTGDCGAGASIRSVNQNGTVTCESDDVGGVADLPDTGAYCDQLAQPVSYGPCSGLRSTVDEAGDVGQRNAIAIGADGLPVVVYNDATNTELKVLHCGNPSCTSGNTTTPLTEAQFVIGTSVAIGTDGLPLISYRDSTSFNLSAAHCGDEGCTSGNTFNQVIGGLGNWSDVAIGTDGFPVISHMQSGNFSIAHCGNVTCSAGNTQGSASGGASNTGIQNSVAIGADGLPVVGVRDDGFTDLLFFRCGNVSCSSGNTFTNVDSSGNVGNWVSIAIGVDGLPIMSYYDAGNGNLKVLHCGDAACSSGNTTTPVDTAGDVGAYTAIAIGLDGKPIISYYDVTNGNLRVLQCGNAACSSGNDSVALDSAGNVGQFTSIAIGTDGIPVVSYYDVTDANLKVARVPQT